MILKTNTVPSNLKNRLEALDENFAICSFDVSNDKAKALIFGFGQDPDFPQLFIYFKNNDSLVEIETGSTLIDMPVGTAFWGEGDECLILSRWDNDTIYKALIDNEMNLESIIEIESIDAYIEKKLDIIEDFIRPQKAIPSYQNSYEKWGNDFVDAMATVIQFQKIGAAGLNDQKKKEYLEQKIKPFEHVLFALNAANEKNEIKINIEQIEKAISF